MDDEALITRHGNDDLPSGSAEHPLVTFALFAFNQEQYVREAVEGALAQTYTPLQIILSDDCSSDSTPAILEEMAAAYNGPHRVVVRRGQKNIGTLSHVLRVAALAEGELIVVAAGDDISLPERTTRIVAAFAGSDAYAYSSDEFSLDASGTRTPTSTAEVNKRNALHRRNPAWLHGATAAYRAAFLKALPIPKWPVLFEDLVFREVMNALGLRTIRSQDNLITYRLHDQNLYFKDDTRVVDPERKYREWERIASSYAYCRSVLADAGAIHIDGLRYVPSRRKALKIAIFDRYFAIIKKRTGRTLAEKLLAVLSALLLRDKDYRITRMTIREVFL